jgi:hypothetical protein
MGVDEERSFLPEDRQPRRHFTASIKMPLVTMA